MYLACSPERKDAWSDSQGRVSLDSQQDCQLMAANQTPEVILPAVPFSTYDPQDYIIEEGTVHLIYGVLDRPFRLLQQLKLSTPFPSLPQDIQTLEVRNTDVNIPTQETTHLSSSFP
uniref:Uncharacterized protein n=1 Tax=Hucho hucho TaxID=62062 RepID=A0A4W5MN40_9TELE